MFLGVPSAGHDALPTYENRAFYPKSMKFECVTCGRAYGLI